MGVSATESLTTLSMKSSMKNVLAAAVLKLPSACLAASTSCVVMSTFDSEFSSI